MALKKVLGLWRKLRSAATGEDRQREREEALARALEWEDREEAAAYQWYVDGQKGGRQ